jgi:hypothetical protein
MSTLSELQSMGPFEFEKAVADVWSAKGYNTEVKSKTNDKAIDVVAKSGNHRILIQAKRYSTGNKIGGPDVRKYATLYQQDLDADQVIIITTSSFTSQAKEIAAEQGVRIIDGRQFSNLVDEYNIIRENSYNSKNYNPANEEIQINEGQLKVLAVGVFFPILYFLLVAITMALLAVLSGNPSLFSNTNEGSITPMQGTIALASMTFWGIVWGIIIVEMSSLDLDMNPF